MNYQYWIIRFVPDVARGEFSNIGIVCGCDTGDWATRFDTKSVSSHGDLSSDLRELNAWVSWFKSSVDRHARGSPGGQGIHSAWVEHLRVRQTNLVQFSDPAPVAVGSAEDGVSLLFPHLVTRLSGRKTQGLTRRKLRAEVRDTLAREAGYVVGRDLFSNPRFQVGRQRGRFDLARMKNADRALTNVWAFNVGALDLMERDIQSWNYLVGRLRRDGASLSLPSESRSHVPLTSDSPIEVVYDPPSRGGDGRRTEIFEAALEAWSLSDVTARTMDDFLATAESA